MRLLFGGFLIHIRQRLWEAPKLTESYVSEESIYGFFFFRFTKGHLSLQTAYQQVSKQLDRSFTKRQNRAKCRHKIACGLLGFSSLLHLLTIRHAVPVATFLTSLCLC